MTNLASKKLKAIYFHNLDATRFLAAFAVFIFHYSNEIKALFPALESTFIFKAFYTVTSKGALGVNFFFVLSGFLITFLILQEKKQTGGFNLGKFLLRRTLRIWPLYFLIVLIGFVVFPLLFHDYSTQHSVVNYVLFLANFDEIWNGGADTINFLTSPWSVAVEEQFYLFWGVALFLLFKVKFFKIPHLLVLLYLISFYFRWIFWEEERIIYYHTISVCQDILMGAFIGWSLFEGKLWLDRLKKIPRWVVMFIYAIGFGMCIGKNMLFSGQLIVLERFILSLFFGFVILDQIRGEHSLFKLGKIGLFNYLGKISYGLYMYHLVIMYVLLRFVINAEQPLLFSVTLFFLLSALLTFITAAVSFKFFESKFLSLKPKK